MAATSLSKHFEKLEVLLSRNFTTLPQLTSLLHQVISDWKAFQPEYQSVLHELETLKLETSKSNKIFQLKLLTSPPPYSRESLFERRVFKSEAQSEVEILKERNRRLEDSFSSSSPSPPSSGYGSPDTFTPKRSSTEAELSSIRQAGTEFSWGTFKSFAGQPLLWITLVELTSLEVDTPLLFASLREHATTIRSIKLDRVLFKGELNQRIEFPQLNEFYVFQKRNMLRKCENTTLSRDTFKSLAFFGHWEIGDVLSLPLRRLEIIVDGWTQFKCNYETGEIVSKLSFTNEILNQLGGRDRPCFQLKKLGLHGCKLELSPAVEFPSSVTYLNFQSVLTTNLSIVEILRACTNLRELRFKNYIDTNGIYLKDIPSQHLKYLILGLCTYTLSIKYSPGITFPNLDTLVFPTNIMDVRILENLSNIFSCKNAVIYLCTSVKCILYKTGYFILNQLLLIQDVSWIYFINFRRCPSEGLDLQLYEEMEDFLIGAGIPSPNSTNFILEKKVELGRTKWLGREVSKEEHQVLEFQQRDGHKFSCWEAYLKRY